MNKLYHPLLSHGFTLKKVGEIFMLAKDNIAFVQNGENKLDAYLIIGSRDAKLLCTDITQFERVISIYTGLTGKQLTRRKFRIWLDKELLEIDKTDTTGDSIVLQSVNHVIEVDKADLYALLELSENNLTLGEESNAVKRLLKRLNFL